MSTFLTLLAALAYLVWGFAYWFLLLTLATVAMFVPVFVLVVVAVKAFVLGGWK